MIYPVLDLRNFLKTYVKFIKAKDMTNTESFTVCSLFLCELYEKNLIKKLKILMIKVYENKPKPEQDYYCIYILGLNLVLDLKAEIFYAKKDHNIADPVIKLVSLEEYKRKKKNCIQDNESIKTWDYSFNIKSLSQYLNNQGG